MGNENNPLSAALCQIVEQYGVDVLTNTSKVIALLKDYAPKQGKEAKLIAAALREGIGTKLLQAVELEENKQQQCIANCIQAFSEEMYITEDASRFAVGTIALALNIGSINDSLIEISEPSEDAIVQNSDFMTVGYEEHGMVGLVRPLINLSDLTLTSPIFVRNGETKKFKDASISFGSQITCEGILEFESCAINYCNAAKILLQGSGGSVRFVNCYICGQTSVAFIRVGENRYDHDGNVKFQNCTMEKCSQLVSGNYDTLASVSFLQCHIAYPCEAYFVTCNKFEMQDCSFSYGYSDKYYSTSACIVADNMTIKNSLFSGKECDCTQSGDRLSPLQFENTATLQQCTFKNSRVPIYSISDEAALNISRCAFTKCDTLSFSGTSAHPEKAKLSITDSEFTDSEDWAVSSQFADGEIINCKFTNCARGISMVLGLIKECKFISCAQPISQVQCVCDCSQEVILKGCSFTRCKDLSICLNDSLIEHCIFTDCQQPIFDPYCKNTVIRNCEYNN